MSVKYTRLPESDPDLSGRSAFDYESVYTYNDINSQKYKSAFTYTSPVSFVPETEVRSTEYSPLIGRVSHVVVLFTCFLLYVLTLPVSIWFSFKVIPNYERLVVFRLGRLVGSKGPGIVFILPCVDRWQKVDTRVKAFSVPPKQLLTKDGAGIEVGADVYCQVSDVQKSVTSVQNLDQSTRVLVQTCLVNLLVQRELRDIESQRAIISSIVQEATNKVASEWGIEICRVEISQIKVLQPPPARAPPTIMFPPGLSASGSVQLPPAFQQLASVFMAAQGHTQPDPSEAPPDLLTAVVSDHLDPDDAPTLAPMKILLAVQAILTESTVQKVAASYQFKVTGAGGGLYHMDLTSGKGSVGEGLILITWISL
ncbi:stomatin-like protein 1 isoform X2 [Gigantopelta aegis]|uniref:stomatin-like protein 1 isoform X2 n=1 Tax=Gigantopelta aegis TaxID=1735272 RepID=UPI001B88B01B|nr:stomatin-like protein 1 isoform X2 [Gigantopelta aegis]